MIHVQLNVQTRNESLYGTDVIEVVNLRVEEVNPQYINHRHYCLRKNLRLFQKDKWTPMQLFYQLYVRTGWNRYN